MKYILHLKQKEQIQLQIDKNDGCEFSEEYSCELEKAGVNSDNAIKKTEWIIDKNIPIFKGENRKYINELILFKE